MDLSTMTSANPDEAHKLWNEVAAERGAEMLTAARPPAPAAQAETVVDTSQQTDAPADTGTTGAQPPHDQQAATATVTNDGAAAVAEPSTADQMKELVEKIGRLEGQLRNVNGHIGGLSTGQQQLREMLNSASKAAQAIGGDAPTQAQVAEAMKNPEEWDRLREDFPEFAAATEKLLEAKLAGLQPKPAAVDQAAIDKMVEERVAQQTAAVRTEVINSHLNSIIDGDWLTEVKSEKFGKWLDAQPEEVKALADSASMSDAAKMLRLYQKATTSNSTQQIVEQRQARLGNSVTPRSNVRAPKAKAPEDMSPQELWNHEAALRERRRASA